MAYDGSIRINTKINTAGFNQGVNKIGQGCKNIGGKVASLTNNVGRLAGKLAALAGLAGLAVLAKQSIEAASNLQEVQNVVDTAFGSMKQKCEDFAKGALESFGLSEYSAKKMASTYMAMGKSMGLSMEDASNMAINVSKRTADIASFYNLSAEEAAVKLKSIYTGETETLKELGIVMTETNLEQFALSQGIDKSYQAMSQGEKVALRYAYVMQASSDAAGDFARTSNSWANQTKVLTERFTALKTVIGSMLITALTPLIQMLNNVVKGITNVATAAKGVLADLFGIEFQDSASTAETTVSDIAKGYEDVADSTKKAKKEQDKFNRSLASFDKINKLVSDKSSSSSDDKGKSGTDSGMIASLLGGSDDKTPINEANDAIEKLRKKIKTFLQDVKAAAESGDFTKFGEALGAAINAGMNNLDWEKIRKFVNKVAKSIATFLNGAIKKIDWAKVGITLAEAFNTAISGLKTFIEEFDWTALGTALGTALYNFFKNLDFGNIAGAISAALKATFNLATGLINGVDWEALPEVIVEKLVDFFTNLDYQGIAEAIGNFVGSAVKAAFNFVTGIHGLCRKLIEAIKNYFIGKKEENGGTWFEAIFGGIVDAIVGIQKWCWNNIVKPFLSGLIEAIAGKEAAKKFKDFTDGMWDAICVAWKAIKATLGIALDLVSGALSDVWDFITDKWDKMKTTLKIGVEFAGEIVDFIGGAISSGIEFITGKAKGGIFSGGAWRDIPQFASGMPSGIRGSLFIAGEAGPEIVAQGRGGSSEILNASQIASAIYSAVSSAMANSGGQDVNVNVIGNGDKMYDIIVNKNRRNKTIYNKNLLG